MKRRKCFSRLLLREDQEITTIRGLITSSLSPPSSSTTTSTSSALLCASTCCTPPTASNCSHWKSKPGPEFKWSRSFPVIIWIVLLLLSDSFAVLANGKNFKCDFLKFPDSGCQDAVTTTCNSETDQCVCRPAYPVNVNGRCFSYREISDLCVTSRQCSKIKAKCIDNAGEEVVVNEESGSSSTPASSSSSAADVASAKAHESSLRMMVGTCKCPDGLFHHPEKNECSVRILGRKCYFNTDCFQRSHSYCDGSRCKCKNGFLQDYGSDECRPSLIALCMFGYVYENGTQKCRPSSKSDAAFDSHPGIRSARPSPLSSSLSALFWPVIAFFLVILLLKMLKEGMRRDCERAAASVANGGSSADPRNRHRRPRSHHHHHRALGHHSRPFRHYASDLLPAIGTVPSPAVVSSSSRTRAPEIIVLMPPPPYSPTATGPEVSLATAMVEEPPTYEEATRK